MGEVVIITGGSSGIGKALKEKFIKNHDTVVSLQRSPSEDENDIICDVTDLKQVINACKIIVARYDRIDKLILNAGIGISGATELIPPESIRKAMDVNYFACHNMVRYLLPYLTPKNGRIIVMSSVAGLFPLPFRSVYSSVKAASLMFGLSLRQELAYTDIQVVTLCPGEIKTNFSANKLAYTDTNSRYLFRVESAGNYVKSREKKRMKMDKVVDKMWKLCCYGNKAMYIIGFKYKVLWLLKRLLPTTFYLNMTNKMLGGEKPKKGDFDKWLSMPMEKDPPSAEVFFWPRRKEGETDDELADRIQNGIID